MTEIEYNSDDASVNPAQRILDKHKNKMSERHFNRLSNPFHDNIEFLKFDDWDPKNKNTTKETKNKLTRHETEIVGNDSTVHKSVTITNSNPDIVTPLQEVKIDDVESHPASISKQILKNISKKWSEFISDKSNENKIAQWEEKLKESYKMFGDTTLSFEEWKNKSKQALANTDWTEHFDSSAADDFESAIRDLLDVGAVAVQKTVKTGQKTKEVLVELGEYISNTNAQAQADWDEDFESIDFKKAAKDLASLGLKTGATAVKTPYKAGALAVRGTKATAGALIKAHQTAKALTVIGKVGSAIATAVVANPIFVGYMMSSGNEALRSQIQDIVGLTEGVFNIGFAQDAKEITALSSNAVNNFVRYFQFDNYHHRVDTGDIAQDAAANAYGNIQDIQKTAVSMWDDPWSASTIWKMWYTASDNGIVDGTRKVIVTAFNYYTGLSNWKVALTGTVASALEYIPKGTKIPNPNDLAIEYQNANDQQPNIPQAIEYSKADTIADMTIEDFTDVFGNDAMSMKQSISGMTDLINKKGFDTQSLINGAGAAGNPKVSGSSMNALDKATKMLQETDTNGLTDFFSGAIV